MHTKEKLREFQRKIYLDYIDNWKLGKVSGTKGNGEQISSYIRKYLFEKFDNKCSKCGWNQVNLFTNKIPLEVEHIDGNCQNNVEENLLLLCPNCHSLTSTYRALNKGYGRKNRREKLTG